MSRGVNAVYVVGVLRSGEESRVCAEAPRRCLTFVSATQCYLLTRVLPHFNANVLLRVFQSIAAIYYESAYLRGDA